MLESLDEHQLLILWVQLFLLVAVATGLGSLCRRYGQPAVIGELAAGLVLGPSILGKIWPDGFDWLFPGDEMQSAALLTVGWVGVVLLLLVTGFETDLGLITKLGRAAVLVATGSLIVPMAIGFGTGFILPESFRGGDTTVVVFALFIAAALSISSLPVIAKILSELGLIRRNFGQITLAAGMANDVVGWLLLGIIAGLATTGSFSPGRLLLTVGGMAVVVLVAFTVGQRLIDAVLRRVRQAGENPWGGLSVAIITTLILAVAMQALGVEAVLGAFVAGILLGRSRFQLPEVRGQIEPLTMAFFAPVFFATAGLRVDLESLSDPVVVVWAVVMVLVASVGKFLGAFVGAKGAGLSAREGVALGAGLNARGALEIVIATIGLSLGVLSESAYTVIVIMAIVTSAAAPPTLRLAVKNWRGSDEERERLDREEALSKNVVVKARRLLLPSRGGPGSIAAAQVMHFAWPREAEVTLFCVGEPEAQLDPLYNVFHERTVDLYRSESEPEDAANRILLESNLGYGVLGVGVGDVSRDGTPLPQLVNDLIQESPIPLVIVRGARDLDGPLPGAFTRALVPVAGGRSSRAAQEIAFNISRQLGTEIHLCHVLQTPSWEESDLMMAAAKARSTADRASVGQQLVEQAASLADELGAQGNLITDVVRSEATPGEGIVSTAQRIEADLVVLGARARKLEGRPYLGANAEHVLEECDATVVVVVVPEESSG